MQARALTIRLIRLAMAAALLLPALLFLFASWHSYRQFWALADERIMRSLDVQQEQALKAFQLVDLALNNAAELVSGMAQEDIRSSQGDLHLELKKLVGAVPMVQSIWIYGADGKALVTSWAHPPPPQSFADRDFFAAHVSRDAGTYYGQVYESVLGAEPFFTVSRRLSLNGTFLGVIEVSVLPSNFFRFFSTLAYTSGLQYSLLRDDGIFLARYPAAPASATGRLDERTGFRRTIAQSPQGGLYTSTSPVDHVERRFGVRRFAETPLYLSSGIATATIRNEWMTEMGSHLIFGIPATAFMLLMLLLVLRRTQNLYDEIDRRSAAEASLRQSQKLDAIGHLTGGVAHDFNNLLTIILGNLEAAQRQLESWTEGGQVKLARRVDNAIHGARRAAELTKRLLAFSRQQPLNPAALDVNRLLTGASDFLQRALGEDVSLEIVGGAGVWSVEADATELEAAVLNLAVNARDAMKEGGKLTIEVSNSYLDEAYCRNHADARPGQYVMIAVTDTGSGMPNEVIDRAFEPFFTTKQSGHGTGLGLSQVYGFVKQSGGHVRIYSEVGEGTTVKIYLPRFDGQPSIHEAPSIEAGRAGQGECILVVEDDTDVRAYIVETLGGLGYDVLQAGGGEEALRIMAEYESIALLLTDVVMPGMNGRKLADEAIRRHPGLRVLFMTGYSRNAIVHQGRLDRGVHLIQKPVTSGELAANVRKVLDGVKHSSRSEIAGRDASAIQGGSAKRS
jgi:signal transduction histidine kinase/CheY-like chemotaxis protein